MPDHPPSVDAIARVLPEDVPGAVRVRTARAAADRARKTGDDAFAVAAREVRALTATRQVPVVNATGVLLHTNLGRSVLAPEAAERGRAAASAYTNLELDLSTGERGGRTAWVTELATVVTGAEDALVVNNNAASLFLSLLAMATGRSVPVSRGELIEIGGSYRLPELMASTGTRLVEVGTTNRTRTTDYEKAIDETTALLLKVHPSNYRIDGFTEDSSIGDLAELAHAHRLPCLFDVGSGLVDERATWLQGPPPAWLAGEPGVVQSLERGADLVMFSGDKLLGGPQAGLIVGHTDLIAGLRRHPATRALRLDGPTLAALEATLEAYADGRAGELPFWTMATVDIPALRRRCEAIAPAGAVVESGMSTIGAGSVPGSEIPSIVVRLPGCGESGHRALLDRQRPIVARRESGDLVVDVRTVDPDDDGLVRDALEDACRS